MGMNKAKIDNLRNRLLDVANALEKVECEDCDNAESIYMTKLEAQRIFAHAFEHGTRGLKKSQIIAAWAAMRK